MTVVVNAGRFHAGELPAGGHGRESVTIGPQARRAMAEGRANFCACWSPTAPSSSTA